MESTLNNIANSIQCVKIFDGKKLVESQKIYYINQYLEITQKNPSITKHNICKEIGISVRKLNEYLKEYGIEKQHKRYHRVHYSYDKNNNIFYKDYYGQYIYDMKSKEFYIPEKTEKIDMTTKRNEEYQSNRITEDNNIKTKSTNKKKKVNNILNDVNEVEEYLSKN